MPFITPRQAREEFCRIASAPGERVPLARTALLVSAGEDAGLDPDEYLAMLDAMARTVRPKLVRAEPLTQLNILSEFLFDHLGFSGNREDYYDPANSLLDRVLVRRVGVPVTLALVYVEVGRRAGVPLWGVGMPGHFLVRHRREAEVFVDVFHGGILLSAEECRERFHEVTQGKIDWRPSFLSPVGNRTFVERVLRNLKIAHLHKKNHRKALRAVNWLLLLQPHSLTELRDRALLYYRLGMYEKALSDLRACMDASPYSPYAREARRIAEHIIRLMHGGREGA